ncbi:phosphoserine phosphatase SerB [Chromobacterium rhizoryzae]|uniref:Phosphoserine phosphatase n=1 Tax=Chromobacterium rhizoryzae TaxID=1778675 RepID=A0AAD0RSA3_9NEIS|nr:phosphoserine phosphatase SerB [Chromobacterium rhizoryzae]AXT47496.1 phosphoserine phosphatase SerB [Chromobacterium rhizoryzae]
MSLAYTLVIQADTLDPHHLHELAHLVEATHMDHPSPSVARLRGAAPAQRAAALALCEQWGYDGAYVEAGRSFADFGLLVSDMDSTLITIECIDEIADMNGLKPQVAAITERSMRGELDFAASLTERVTLLRGLQESALEQVYRERVKLMPGAEALLAACKRHGVKFMLVSGGFTFFTDRLKTELGLDFAYANQLEIENGALTGRVRGPIVDAAAKKRLLIQQREALGLKPEQVLAMGDGANDLQMLAEAGVGVAVHAKPVVRAQADIAVNHGGLDRILNLYH